MYIIAASMVRHGLLKWLGDVDRMPDDGLSKSYCLHRSQEQVSLTNHASHGNIMSGRTCMSSDQHVAGTAVQKSSGYKCLEGEY